jgi:hypothetical protein
MRFGARPPRPVAFAAKLGHGFHSPPAQGSLGGRTSAPASLSAPAARDWRCAPGSRAASPVQKGRVAQSNAGCFTGRTRYAARRAKTPRQNPNSPSGRRGGLCRRRYSLSSRRTQVRARVKVGRLPFVDLRGVDCGFSLHRTQTPSLAYLERVRARGAPHLEALRARLRLAAVGVAMQSARAVIESPCAVMTRLQAG